MSKQKLNSIPSAEVNSVIHDCHKPMLGAGASLSDGVSNDGEKDNFTVTQVKYSAVDINRLIANDLDKRNLSIKGIPIISFKALTDACEYKIASAHFIDATVNVVPLNNSQGS